MIHILSLLIVVFFLMINSAYKRYCPVRGIPYIKESCIKNHLLVLDIRDYNETEKGSPSLTIPYAYLKRYDQEIPRTSLHVVASDQLELNLGLRYLKAKGFKVASCSLTKHQSNQKQKGDICHDIR